MLLEFYNKNELFDDISKMFYCRNFGTASKSEIELLMFHFYIEELIKQNSYENGVVNYKAISDYRIAKDLGITPQRVRNLKIKNELVYRKEDFNWKLSLKQLLSDENRIRVDNKYIKINIPDPTLFLEIKNHIEESGGYVEISLNSSLLTVPAKDFFEIVKLICEPEELSEIEANIIEQYEKTSGEKIEEKDGWDKALMLSEIISNSTGAISDLVSLFTPTGIAIKGIKKIIEEMIGGGK